VRVLGVSVVDISRKNNHHRDTGDSYRDTESWN
jgi:hypothetical protein